MGAGKWVRWHPNEWVYTKNIMPYKNKSAASMTKMNGKTHTTINPPVRLFCGRREIREKTVLDGRQQRQTEQVDLFPLQ
jgi:hypothetical protein